MKHNVDVGILAFQGDFARHEEAFRKLGSTVRLVKSPNQLGDVDSFVIPGGESSVIDRFIQSHGMGERIREFAAVKPVWGTCAGMILLARQVENDPALTPLKLLDITVDRNGYGRQYDSFVATGEFRGNGKTEDLEMVFIRAPRVVAIDDGVEILGRCRDEVTIVRQGKVLATAFHPELTDSLKLQEYFLSLK